MARSGKSRLLAPLAATSLVLLIGAACDRQDNHWNAFDPARKILTVEADTMHLAEGGPGQVFRVHLPMVPDDTVLVLVAAGNAQVSATPETLIFVPLDDDWTLPRLVTVRAADDLIDEGPHTSTVAVLAVSRDADYNGQQGTGVVPLVIADNDRAGVRISESALTVVESAFGSVTENYRVRLLSEPTADVTIAATVLPAEPSFHLDPAVLVFTAADWQIEQEVRLWADLDQIDANSLSLVVQHAAASNDPNYDAGLAVPSISVALLDDTLPPTATLSLAVPGVTTLLESGGTESLQVVITLDRGSAVPVTVHLATRDGQATGGADFQALDQDVVFAPGGALAQAFDVVTLDDNLMEDPEDFQVVISAVENVLVGENNRLDLRVVDNDQVTLHLAGVDVDEDAGNATFVVTMAFAVPLPVSFTLTTADGTATAGSDYRAIDAVFTITPGQTARSVPVVVLADPAHEDDENLTAVLGSLSGNVVWDGVAGSLVIRDDDPQSVAMADLVAGESQPYAEFMLDLAAPYNDPVTLTVSTINGDGVGPVTGQEDAIGGQDFTTVTNAAWTIPAGVTSDRFRVALTPESAAEATRETFRLRVEAATMPGFAGLEARCEILDDDQPQVAVGDASVLESSPSANFVVTLVNLAGDPVLSQADVSFDFTTVDQTAQGGLDYTASAGRVVIPAGAAGATVVVPVLEDTHDDDNETFVLALSGIVNATFREDDSAPFCLITDNEFPSINLGQVVSAENEGTMHEFTVFLTTPRQDATGFTLSLAAGSSQGPGLDYTFSGAGYRVIPPFTSSLTFQVPFLDDQLAGEPNEVLQARLDNAEVALGVASLDLTIIDAPVLNIQPAAATEGSDLVFNVLLTAASTADISFRVQYSSGTANVLTDIVSGNRGPFTIPAGSTTYPVVTPTIAGDGGDLAVEDFVITLISPVNATLGAFNSAVGRITDGDPPPLNLAGSATAAEGADVVFTVNLGWTSGVAVQFFVAYADGTAAGAGIDFDDSDLGPFTIPPGTLSTTIAVPTQALDGPESAVEDFVVSLGGAVNGVLGTTTTATGFIQDGDQPALTIPVGDTAVEGADLNFTIHLSAPTIVPVFFGLEFGNGSTQGPDDFLSPGAGPFSMMPGTTDTTITVLTVDDVLFENTEQFVVRLAPGPTNAAVGTPVQANGVINDND
jgi:hypothetical protein